MMKLFIVVFNLTSDEEKYEIELKQRRELEVIVRSS